CAACLSISDGSAVDVIELDAASNRGIDDIKEIRDNVKYPPMHLRYKVFVIDEAHQLSDAAKDAFLKTLEEPPAHAIFVLATTEAHEIPLTIRSRCQQFDFRRGSVSDIAGRIRYVLERENRTADDSAVDVLARNARGSWRDSLSLLEQVLSFTDQHVTVDHVNTVLGTVDEDILFAVSDVVAQGDASAAFDLAGKLVHEGKDVRELIKAIAGHFRDLVVASVGAGQDVSVKISERARLFTKERLVELVEIFSSAEKDLRWNDQHRLVLELAFMKAIFNSAPVDSGTIAPAAQPVRPVQPKTAPATYSAPPKPRTEPRLQETPVKPSARPTDAPIEPAITDQASSAPTSDVSLIRTRQMWPRVLKHIKEVQRKAPLSGMLREAEVSSVDDTTVYLSIDKRFGFHIANIQQSANLETVSQALEAIMGKKMRVKVVVSQGVEPQLPMAEEIQEPPMPEPTGDMVQDVLQMFGGRILEDIDDENYDPWKET
ncbi:MAG TPA: DNA polymerase III subunit gamma/tau, partial [Armatimonadota bacterium]|nr:DNA polymerase III subunit gamma/tau [Armatimonadota bacterium]